METLPLNLEQMGLRLPYNMVAEQAVLGTAILSSDNIPLLVEKLKPEYFYSRQNAGIFSAILSLFTAGHEVDFVTLLDAVNKTGVFETEEDAKVYLATLAETVPSVSNTERYADLVYEKHLLRLLMQAAGDILQSSQEGDDAQLLLENAEQRIYEIRTGRDSTAMVPLKTAVFDTFSRLQVLSGPDREKYLGIPTGFRYLDTVLTGMGKSDLIILAARPGMGKTSFALNIAANVAKRGTGVAIFSLEMTKEQLASRLLASEAQIDSNTMRNGNLTTDEWATLARSSEALTSAPIYLDDNAAITIPEMKAKIRRLNMDKSKPNIGLVVIDYLQLMESPGRRNENRTQEVSALTRNLKIMAKELDVPVITLSQLSRNPERTGTHRPTLSDLRDSGSIEQDADVVLFLYRESYYSSQNGEPDNGMAECIVAKNRHGATTDVQLGWKGVYTTFYDVDTVHTDDY